MKQQYFNTLSGNYILWVVFLNRPNLGKSLNISHYKPFVFFCSTVFDAYNFNIEKGW